MKLSFKLVMLLFTITIVMPKELFSQTDYNLPAVVNPSPQSMAFTKYGDYPMTDYTGLANITIPLHTVTSRRLSLPITMSFHASGRMANEINGTLGMRWTLNCGGLVTRTMKGVPDEWNRATPYQINFNVAPSFDDLYKSCTDGKIQGLMQTTGDGTMYDSEFDLFNYVLPNGKSGHFILKNENGVKVPMVIPYEALKIEIQKSATANGYIQYISITDVDGTKYVFGNSDGASADAIESNWEADIVLGLLGDVPTGWYLTKIISSDGTDEISLSYTARYSTSISTTQSATIYDQSRNDDSYFWMLNTSNDPYQDYLRGLLMTYHFEQTDVVPQARYNAVVPTVNAIQFNGGAVSLNYSSIAGNLFLNEIVAKQNTDPFKKIKFNLTKHTGESDVYYLDNLAYYGEDQTTISEKYGFNYYEGAVEPLQFASANKDWWGYYRQWTDHLLLQRSVDVVPIGGYGGSLVYQNIGFDASVVPRNADENSKKIGMLKVITYPTGGQTEFVYESNMYDYAPYYQGGQNPALLEGPGLRIKEIISKPVAGKNIHKLYKYGIYEDGRGFINEKLRIGSTSRSDLMVAEGNAMHYWTYTSSDPGNPSGYGANNQTGYRTRNYFSDPYINFDFGNSPIKYDAVSEYYIEDEVPQQKTQHRYSWENTELLGDFQVNDRDEIIHYVRKFADPQNAWLKPVLTNKSIYKYSGSQFDIIRKETYEYVQWAKDETWDMPTYLHTNVSYSVKSSSGNIDPIANYNTIKDYDYWNCSIYGYGYRQYKTGAQLLTKTTIEELTADGTITTIKNASYEDAYYFLRTEDTQNSKNDIVKNSYSYPHDFTSSSVYQQMVQKNILAPIIVQQSFVNDIPMKKTITNYYSPYANVFVPQSIEMQIRNNPKEIVATFNSYDDVANILEQQKSDNVKEVYLWGYNKKYPVAKIVGTDYTTALSKITDQLMLNSPSSDEALRTQLNNLRTIPGAMVTTYTYKPLIGMTSATDASGKTIFYEYDTFQRLKLIRDQDGKIVKQFDYKYQNQ